MRRFVRQASALAMRGLPILGAVWLFACAPTDTMRIDPMANSQNQLQATSGAGGFDSSADLARLERLWAQRHAADSANQDYPIGPGDVLTISVPDIDQLAQRRVRVSPRGTIELPMLGTIQAAGLSEDGLASELDAKLRKYMYTPQATVFVDEYHNREVAVIGAVNRPGLVLLSSPSESLLDVITQAGGLSSAAADEIILIPSQPGTVPMAPRLGSSLSSQFTDQSNGAGNVQDSAGSEGQTKPATRGALEAENEGSNPSPSLALAQNDSDYDGAGDARSISTGTAGPGAASFSAHNDTQFAAETAHQSRTPVGGQGAASQRTTSQPQAPDSEQVMRWAGSDDAITFKLKGANLDGAGGYINLPMRPGDVLIVPGGGDVMVVGWVQQPGRFQVGSGLTVLGAIGAAGGPMYAAKTNNIALIRTGTNGAKVTIPIDMDKITRGEAPDPPVKANDVIDVPYSGLRIGPYIFYSILTKMGIAGPVVPY
jgi:protein involved in polysaccharide export with SLBB domain